MSKVIVSYAMDDKFIAGEVMNSLREAGHEIVTDNIPTGAKASNYLRRILKEANIFIMLFSPQTIFSTSAMGEFITARAYAEESNRMLIIPVMLGDFDIPSVVRDIEYIKAKDVDFSPQTLVDAINELISRFEGSRVAQEQQKEEINEAVQGDLAAYVDEAINTQKQYAQAHKNSAKTWYVLGYLSLLSGLITTVYLANLVITTGISGSNYVSSISAALLNVVAIAILAALAKYSYSLGKSYMSESLKSSDRIHAIQFGRFFLRAYGAQASSTEVREVFQHWNIDRASTFSSLDSAQIDPQVASMIVQLISAVSGKGAEKSK